MKPELLRQRLVFRTILRILSNEGKQKLDYSKPFTEEEITKYLNSHWTEMIGEEVMAERMRIKKLTPKWRGGILVKEVVNEESAGS